MATRKKSSSKSGGAWFGLVLGIVLGVAAAVAVALFVTKAPMPFKDKASRNAPTTWAMRAWWKWRGARPRGRAGRAHVAAGSGVDDPGRCRGGRPRNWLA